VRSPDDVGVILTGMGRDGAQGLLAMRQAGASTLGQDEASCVVYGMPRSAFEIGAVERQLPLSSIGPSPFSIWPPPAMNV
jgi:two-component system chemotaxis response regulator CheB